MPDLRLESLTDVDYAVLFPLMEEEASAWLRELDWDYSPIRKILSSFMQQRLLPGFVASREGTACGYTYFLIQRGKGVIGSLYASAPDTQDIAELILSRAIHWLKESQSIRRIESQIFSLNNLEPTSVFSRNGFQHYPRHYLELNLSSFPWERQYFCDEKIVPWSNEYLAQAAEVTLRSYRNEVDAVICEDYCSAPGCEGYLRSLVENPGCGIFNQDASYIGLDSRGFACGFVISSRISSKSAMIPQISIHPSHQGRGLGTSLVYYSLKRLQAQGYSSVRLTVTQDNRRAYEWYRRLGFRQRRSFGAYVWQRA